MITNPMEIENRSFEIISSELEGKEFKKENANILKRVIHTSADFDYADNLFFSEGVVASAQNTLRNGAAIITDTQMGSSGINKRAAAKLGCEVLCFVDSPEVAQIAKESGHTRSREAVDYAARTVAGPLVFAVGNAPTALIRICELVEAGVLDPALVIAVPVGFVNVVESKELVLSLKAPHIVARGRKGGSNVAAAIVNALMYEITDRD
ncbi:MAG: precorrin-8X methylmutase [Eubacteriaceae bacterium]|nr:precorrin-8X methylmutase [Eubacteriaceae bacterium]